MRYYLDLFTPETWRAFRKHGSTISGFRIRQAATAEQLHQGDILVCYLVRLMRWCGLLRIKKGPYIDNTPIFMNPDPFEVRFEVEPLVVLDIEKSIPIVQSEIWSSLNMTKSLPYRARGWAQHANLRASLRQLGDEDGKTLEQLLTAQLRNQNDYPLTDEDRNRIGSLRQIRTVEREVVVEVSDDQETIPENQGTSDLDPASTDSSRAMQAAIANIGIKMGFKIWIPNGDKQRVLERLSPQDRPRVLDVLPLNYDETTNRTISLIDVIWFRNNSIARAFEVEHTTAIYSGLLRMADLLALQPNMNIRLHIVAPDERRDKVFREMKRPVFSLLDRGPLYESCSFLPYSSVHELAELHHLTHMNDTIIETYEELAQDE